MKYLPFIAILMASFAANAAFVVDMDADGIYETNAGEMDNNVLRGTSIVIASLGGKPALQDSFLKFMLGADTIYNFIAKDETVPYYTTQDADTGDLKSPPVYATQISQPGDYYLLKNSQYALLMENVALFDWAVFDTSPTAIVYEHDKAGDTWVNAQMTDTIGSFLNIPSSDTTISHISISQFTGTKPPPSGSPPTNDIPVPAPLALMAMGLIGMVGMRKLRKQ
jgi:hypothetical protein